MKKKILSFFISVFLISISLVSCIGIWKNRQLYFKDYIVGFSHLSSIIESYSYDFQRMVNGLMSDEEYDSFMYKSPETFYYVTNNETGELFSNLPEDTDYATFISQPNILQFPFQNSTQSYWDIISRDAATYIRADIAEIGTNVGEDSDIEFGTAQPTYTGSIFVDIETVESQYALGSIGCYIKIAYQQRMILIGESIIFVVTLISSILFFLLMGRKALIKESTWINKIKPDGLFLCAVMSTVAISFLLPQYILRVKSFSSMTERFILYFLLILFVFFMISLTILMIIKIFRWQNNRKLHVEYQKEIINLAEKIADGYTDVEVPIIGSGYTAQIAEAINQIRSNYVLSLEEVKKSERLKYELVTNISHDLRTPLTLVLNYIDLLKRDEMSKEKLHYISQAENQAEKLHLLIDDLFELSKLESGNMVLVKEDTDIVLLWKQIKQECQEQLKERNLELVLEYSQDKIRLSCDSSKVWRVFDNLLQNAIKYSVPNTRIYVSLVEDEITGQVHVHVKNITAERITFDPAELFLRFKRGTEARDTEGSGLGLAIAKSIVLLHGGNIRIELEGDMFKVLINFIK